MTEPLKQFDPETQLALRIFQLCKQGYFITFGHRKVDIGSGELDDYYILTVRPGGEDYKRTELSRPDVVAHIRAGDLPQYVIQFLERIK